MSNKANELAMYNMSRTPSRKGPPSPAALCVSKPFPSIDLGRIHTMHVSLTLENHLDYRTASSEGSGQSSQSGTKRCGGAENLNTPIPYFSTFGSEST